jgi:UPF0755 protein
VNRSRFLHSLPAFVFLFLVGSLVYRTFWSPNSFGERREVYFTVSRGETFRSIVDSLDASGLIENKFLFGLAGRALGWTKELKVGRYVLEDGSSNYDILQALHSGRSTVSILVTIPEGSTTRQIARMLSRQVGIDSAVFLHAVNDTAFIHTLGLEGPSLEGYLFPESYQFYWQMDEYEIARKLVAEFQKFYTDSLRDRAADLGLSPTEILTMASIVESETSVDSERAIVASVYYNRLKKGMRLEADPTIQYLLSDGPRRLRYSDLAINSPYNTYLNSGLPPSPINNPGRKSIFAALYPAQEKYLYFVSNGMGGHVFSKTYEDHLRAVQAYRRTREMAARDTTSAN